MSEKPAKIVWTLPPEKKTRYVRAAQREGMGLIPWLASLADARDAETSPEAESNEPPR